MGCVPSITRIGTSFFLLVSLPAVVFAADVRVQPIDAFILLDRSTAMAGSVAAAGEWLCDSFVDPILMEGDRVTVWSFSDGATLIADASIGVPGSKEGLKEAIRSVSSDSGGPDFPAAIRAAARAEAARGDRNRMAVVMDPAYRCERLCGGYGNRLLAAFFPGGRPCRLEARFHWLGYRRVGKSRSGEFYGRRGGEMMD